MTLNQQLEFYNFLVEGLKKIDFACSEHIHTALHRGTFCYSIHLNDFLNFDLFNHYSSQQKDCHKEC